jgi:hypothetical protein
LEIWPEFFFSTERQFRIDYAIPILSNSTPLKIAFEVNGEVWSKRNSGHSSGTGILRDYEKANLVQSLGWMLITTTPGQMFTIGTIQVTSAVVNQSINWRYESIRV